MNEEERRAVSRPRARPRRTTTAADHNDQYYLQSLSNAPLNSDERMSSPILKMPYSTASNGSIRPTQSLPRSDDPLRLFEPISTRMIPKRKASTYHVLGQCSSSESLPTNSILTSYDKINNETMRSPMMYSPHATVYNDPALHAQAPVHSTMESPLSDLDNLAMFDWDDLESQGASILCRGRASSVDESFLVDEKFRCDNDFNTALSLQYLVSDQSATTDMDNERTRATNTTQISSLAVQEGQVEPVHRKTLPKPHGMHSVYKKRVSSPSSLRTIPEEPLDENFFERLDDLLEATTIPPSSFTQPQMTGQNAQGSLLSRILAQPRKELCAPTFESHLENKNKSSNKCPLLTKYAVNTLQETPSNTSIEEPIDENFFSQLDQLLEKADPSDGVDSRGMIALEEHDREGFNTKRGPEESVASDGPPVSFLEKPTSPSDSNFDNIEITQNQHALMIREPAFEEPLDEFFPDLSIKRNKIESGETSSMVRCAGPSFSTMDFQSEPEMIMSNRNSSNRRTLTPSMSIPLEERKNMRSHVVVRQPNMRTRIPVCDSKRKWFRQALNSPVAAASKQTTQAVNTTKQNNSVPEADIIYLDSDDEEVTPNAVMLTPVKSAPLATKRSVGPTTGKRTRKRSDQYDRLNDTPLNRIKQAMQIESRSKMGQLDRNNPEEEQENDHEDVDEWVPSRNERSKRMHLQRPQEDDDTTSTMNANRSSLAKPNNSTDHASTVPHSDFVDDVHGRSATLGEYVKNHLKDSNNMERNAGHLIKRKTISQAGISRSSVQKLPLEQDRKMKQLSERYPESLIENPAVWLSDIVNDLPEDIFESEGLPEEWKEGDQEAFHDPLYDDLLLEEEEPPKTGQIETFDEKWAGLNSSLSKRQKKMALNNFEPNSEMGDSSDSAMPQGSVMRVVIVCWQYTMTLFFFTPYPNFIRSMARINMLCLPENAYVGIFKFLDNRSLTRMRENMPCVFLKLTFCFNTEDDSNFWGYFFKHITERLKVPNFRRHISENVQYANMTEDETERFLAYSKHFCEPTHFSKIRLLFCSSKILRACTDFLCERFIDTLIFECQTLGSEFGAYHYAIKRCSPAGKLNIDVQELSEESVRWLKRVAVQTLEINVLSTMDRGLVSVVRELTSVDTSKNSKLMIYCLLETLTEAENLIQILNRADKKVSIITKIYSTDPFDIRVGSYAIVVANGMSNRKIVCIRHLDFA